MASIPVGILGATGMVGQQFIALLAAHPWFKVDWLGASQRSEGKAFRDAAAWRLPNHLPDDVAAGRSTRPRPGRAPKLVFSGLDSSVAGEIEGAFAEAGPHHRQQLPQLPDGATVPLLIPEVNADHLALLEAQGAARGWKGRIVTNPNCATVVLAMALAPLRQFGLEDDDGHDAAGDFRRRISGRAVVGHSRQRHSAHRRRRRREDRNRNAEDSRLAVEREGRASSRHSSAPRRPACPVQNGHTGSISVGLEQRPTPEAIIDAWTSFKGRPQELDLPSAPPQPIVYLTEANRPQPILDVNRDGGMTVTVGRLRPCPLFDYKFVALGHNTIRGAAGAAILNAELMHREGLL